jgi:PAS domain S-box-containing protein
VNRTAGDNLARSGPVRAVADQGAYRLLKAPPQTPRKERTATARKGTAKEPRNLSAWTHAELIDEIRRLRRLSASGKPSADNAQYELEYLREELENALLELGKSEAEASASSERYAALFEFSPIAYTVLDRFGVIRTLNVRAAELLSEDRHPIIGKPLLVYAVQSDRQTFLDHMRRCRAGEAEVDSEILLSVRSGLLVPVRLVSRALSQTDEDRLYQTALIDLTERKASEERLRVAERLASLGTFAAGLAHEINNPLNSILLSAQVALALVCRSSADPEIVQTLEQIVEESRRGGRLVHNMLAFAKQEVTQKWPADLNAIVRRAVTLVQAAHGDECVMSLQLTPHLPQVQINPTEIEQVLMNLIRNAGEAARNGPCRMLIRTEPHLGKVRLTVADNGPGIPPEKLPHIFDPFYTTRRSSGGTGLGLSIVYAIITGHGGTIRCESTPSQGTRFVIELPAHENGEFLGKYPARRRAL